MDTADQLDAVVPTAPAQMSRSTSTAAVDVLPKQTTFPTRPRCCCCAGKAAVLCSLSTTLVLLLLSLSQFVPLPGSPHGYAFSWQDIPDKATFYCEQRDWPPVSTAVGSLATPLYILNSTACPKSCECGGRLCDFDQIASDSYLGARLLFGGRLTGIGAQCLGLFAVIVSVADACSYYCLLNALYVVLELGALSLIAATDGEDLIKLLQSFLLYGRRYRNQGHAECTDEWFGDFAHGLLVSAIVALVVFLAFCAYMVLLTWQLHVWRNVLVERNVKIAAAYPEF
jgi:hypothetical protein